MAAERMVFETSEAAAFDRWFREYVNGFSFSELADMLGCSERDALSRVRRAQRALRKSMGSPKDLNGIRC